MLRFNYSPGSKTPKGTMPLKTRIVTKDHDAYKLYLRGKELQLKDGKYNSRVDPKYIDMAIEELKQKEQNKKPYRFVDLQSNS